MSCIVGEELALYADMPVERVFLLSPASCGGKRAALLFNDRASFPLARSLHGGEEVALGDVFSFLSGLYFRGKLAYARTFARPRRGTPGVLVITPTRGLLRPVAGVTLATLREFAEVDIASGDPRYLEPLSRDAAALAEQLGPSADVVLLGSIATGKYVDTLAAAFGERLLFPEEFIGRGDMSRGGLMLRRVVEDRELTYIPASTPKRTGPRPPRLERRPATVGAADTDYGYDG